VSDGLVVCVECGQERKAHLELTHGPLCERCRRQLHYRPKPCPTCGITRVVAYRDPAGTAVCAGCAGEDSAFACVQCGSEEHPYGAIRCARCFLTERLNQLLTDPSTGHIHARLRPVFETLIAVERPQTTLYWLRRKPGHGPRILGEMARGQTPISHATFEALPSDKSHNYLRDLLAAVGVLPAYEAQIERMIPWLRDLLATLPAKDAEIIDRFARWQILRRLRAKAARGDLTKSVVLLGRARILAAGRLLAWLTEYGTTIVGMSQGDLEHYLTTHPGSHSTQSTFINWVRATGINTRIRIPALPDVIPKVTMSDAERWGHVETLLHDESIRLYSRIAGLFILLFAQSLTAICRMRSEQVTVTDDRVFVRFEDTPIQMPEPLDAMIREHQAQRGHASYASRDSRWLFPGGIPGNHLATENIRAQLVQRGIKPWNSRHAALFQLAAEVPTPLLAELLGIGMTTATRWAALASRTWGPYIAQR
jgi:hypothetical protein